MKKLKFLSTFLSALLIFDLARGQNFSQDHDSNEYFRIGVYLLENYQFEKALEPLQHCSVQDPQNVAYLEKLAYCNFQLGRLNAAKNNYRALIELDSVNVTALNNLGIIFSREGRYKEALHQYLKLVKIDSVNSVYYKQAAGLFQKQKKIEEAIMFYSTARRLNPLDITVVTDLAKIYEDNQLLVLADTLVDNGLSMDSTNIVLLLLKTNIDYKLKNYKGVLENVARLLEQGADTSTFILKVAGISSYHQQKYEQSVKMLQEIMSLGIESEFIHYYLGLAYRSLGKTEISAVHFEKAVQYAISENISTYYTNLAISREDQENYEEAIKAYQAAYKTSKDQKLLYFLARNYDTYYAEKNTALLYYEKYLAADSDTENNQMKVYAKHRVNKLKEIIHFELDSLR